MYQTGEVVFQTGEVVYQTGEVVYQTREAGYSEENVVAAGDVLSQAVGGILQESPGGVLHDADEDESEEEDQEHCGDEILRDGLVYFDSCYKTAQAVTYNKKEESGILMVRSSTQLLHAFVGMQTHSILSPLIFHQILNYIHMYVF